MIVLDGVSRGRDSRFQSRIAIYDEKGERLRGNMKSTLIGTLWQHNLHMKRKHTTFDLLAPLIVVAAACIGGLVGHGMHAAVFTAFVTVFALFIAKSFGASGVAGKPQCDDVEFDDRSAIMTDRITKDGLVMPHQRFFGPFESGGKSFD